MQELSLREIQKESLKVLKLVDYICRQENLTYCLFYGTLIGAIRHNGFIPWDDDIDIVMPRNDYDKLKRYFIDNKDNLKPFVFLTLKQMNSTRICLQESVIQILKLILITNIIREWEFLLIYILLMW
ncbi:LicD family protein [Treponema phagedenis]|uniref:LicD family protein n=1 Tax=Treponema phagedenis TaxID=162 RepID=UPI001CA42FD2|nr:LicD family protein [Treponema phagedenis]